MKDKYIYINEKKRWCWVSLIHYLRGKRIYTKRTTKSFETLRKCIECKKDFWCKDSCKTCPLFCLICASRRCKSCGVVLSNHRCLRCGQRHGQPSGDPEYCQECFEIKTNPTKKNGGGKKYISLFDGRRRHKV
jgi:hypothetical protein